jgi:hypothetical protein
LEIYEFTALMQNFLVEIDKKIPFFLKERSEIVLIVFKERTVVITRNKSLPMEMAPVTVIADTNILHQALSVSRFLHRYSKGESSVWRVNHASVAVSLFQVMLILLNNTSTPSIEVDEILHRWQICRWKY